MEPSAAAAPVAVAFRAAAAGDTPWLAWVMLAASRSHLARGLWEVALDLDERGSLAWLERLAVTTARSWSHHAHFAVATVDRLPVAALCGYDPRESGGPVLFRAMAEVGQALGWSAQRFAGVSERLGPIGTCAADPCAGAWVIENVATRPELRRRGLCVELLDRILERGRCRGHRRALVSVLIGNTAAERAYEKVGFRVVGEKRHASFEAAFGSPGQRHLLREL